VKKDVCPQDIVSINPERLTGQHTGRLLVSLPARPFIIATGASRDGHALSGVQRVPIAHQFQRRLGGITASDQPARILGCLLQLRDLIRRKKLVVLGMGSSMFS
jgi:hypothetical protein